MHAVLAVRWSVFVDVLAREWQVTNVTEDGGGEVTRQTEQVCGVGGCFCMLSRWLVAALTLLRACTISGWLYLIILPLYLCSR